MPKQQTPPGPDPISDPGSEPATPERRHATRKARAWQRMLSGRRLDLLNPAPKDIEIEDIAHGLARVARWNGQTTGKHAFSVAQHALVVEEIFTACAPGAAIHLGLSEELAGSSNEPAGSSDAPLRSNWRLAALLHDAPEYVIGDMISPFKTALGLDYKTFERRLLEAIHLRFELPAAPPPVITIAIKHADRISAYYEAINLAGFSIIEADKYFGKPAALPRALQTRLEALAPWPVATAQRQFLASFQRLTKRRL